MFIDNPSIDPVLFDVAGHNRNDAMYNTQEEILMSRGFAEIDLSV